MFILVTDKYGYETFRLQVRNFNKKESLNEAVRYSLVKFMEISSTVDWQEKISLVLNKREIELMEEVCKRLYGVGHSSGCLKELFAFVARCELKRLFGDNEKFRIIAEDICFKDSRNRDMVSTGISVYRVKRVEKSCGD